jgi:hypothetical protein
MKAGPDLDLLIARKVMHLEEAYISYQGVVFKKWMPTCYWWECAPSYSTDISAAWEVVEKIQRTGLILIPSTYTIAQEDLVADRDDYGWDWSVEGDSMPHAICLAALHILEASESTREK